MNLGKLSETPPASNKVQSEKNSKLLLWVEVKRLQSEKIKTD